jgi:uncharacterized membrane protein YkvA (DUF1232 family)
MLRGVSDRLFNWEIVNRHLFLSQNISRFLKTFRSHSVSSTKCSAAALIAVSSAVRSFQSRYDLLNFDERSWSKFATKVAAVYLLVITVPPDATPDVISKYFYLEKNLVTKIALNYVTRRDAMKNLAVQLNSVHSFHHT